MTTEKKQFSFWADPDVAEFLDSLEQGLKGKLINKALRQASYEMGAGMPLFPSLGSSLSLLASGIPMPPYGEPSASSEPVPSLLDVLPPRPSSVSPLPWFGGIAPPAPPPVSMIGTQAPQPITVGFTTINPPPDAIAGIYDSLNKMLPILTMMANKMGALEQRIEKLERASTKSEFAELVDWLANENSEHSHRYWIKRNNNAHGLLELVRDFCRSKANKSNRTTADKE